VSAGSRFVAFVGGIAVIASALLISPTVSSAAEGNMEGSQVALGATENNPVFDKLIARAAATRFYAKYGFAVTAKVTETIVEEPGEPYLDVRYEIGLRNKVTAHPKVSIDRVAREYGTVVPENWPFTTTAWGSIATDEIPWEASTFGWKKVPYANLNAATTRLLRSLGNPDTIHGPAQAMASTSVLNTPYSVEETFAWAGDNGLIPWGTVLDDASEFANNNLVSATVEVDSGGDDVYSMVFNDPFDLVKSRTLTAIVRGGLVIEATREIRFADPGGGGDQIVVQTSRAKEFGNRSPLPVEFDKNNTVTSTTLGVSAGRQSLNASMGKAIALVSQELKKSGVRGKITAPQIVRAAKKVQATDSRWYRPTQGAINSYTTRLSANIGPSTVSVQAKVDTGFGLFDCVMRMVPAGKVLKSAGFVCLPGIPGPVR